MVCPGGSGMIHNSLECDRLASARLAERAADVAAATALEEATHVCSARRLTNRRSYGQRRRAPQIGQLVLGRCHAQVAIRGGLSSASA
eukprot:262803-Prymnesium_polylepis.1